MKKIEEINSGKIRLVPDALQRLYQEMNFAKPIFDEAERDEFLTKIDSDVSIEIYEEQMIPEMDQLNEAETQVDFDEWYEKYQRRHFKKYGKYLYI